METFADLIRRGREAEAVQALKQNSQLLYEWPDGSPPLHLAIERGMLQLAEALLRNGHQVDMRNAYGETCYHVVTRYAVAVETDPHGCADSALSLLQAYGAASGLRNNAGRTPLNQLFWYGTWRGDRVRIAESYLSLGEDPNAADNEGNTALHHLSAQECFADPSLVRLMLTAGADLTARNQRGETPQEVLLNETNRGSHIHMERSLFEELLALLAPTEL